MNTSLAVDALDHSLHCHIFFYISAYALRQSDLTTRISSGRTQVFGDEARLLQRLMKGYVKATRPVANASHTITVKVNFALTQILDVVSIL